MALYFWIQGLSRTAAIAVEMPWTLLFAAYNVYFHGRWGQNIGKMVTGIRVVSVSGDPISWNQAFLRFSVDGFLGVALAVSSLAGLVRIPPAVYAELAWSDRADVIADLSPGSDFLFYATNAWVERSHRAVVQPSEAGSS